MMGFTMIPRGRPLPDSLRGLEEQQAKERRRHGRRRQPPDSEVRGRPYNWRRDGV